MTSREESCTLQKTVSTAAGNFSKGVTRFSVPDNTFYIDALSSGPAASTDALAVDLVCFGPTDSNFNLTPDEASSCQTIMEAALSCQSPSAN